MNDDIIRFYKSAAWLHVRQEQLEADHYECQRCKHMGKYKNVKTPRRYTKATLVHHDFRVRQFPQYKLMRFVGGVRNMYSLCDTCHEIEHHGERGFVRKEKDLNEERW